MLTPNMIAKCVAYSHNASPTKQRELIGRAYDFGSGKTPADVHKLMEVLQQTACLAEALYIKAYGNDHRS